MTPTYRMPDGGARRRQAALAEVGRALAAARCAARLAGLGTHESTVRELLLKVIEEITQGEQAVQRLVATSLRDGVP